MGPPMRKHEGEKWTAPDVLKELKKEEKIKRLKRRGLVVCGKGGSRSFLDRDADEESWTRIKKTHSGLYRDKLWRERLQKGATILARHRDN
ncbi:hypothetical protein TNCV_2317561 [Trichonephila clavipes]|nr:hypothetical protein TNCV_2317561 [Trichonephila clavipes]